ncbi:hypothetical protein NGM10_09785 [Halorussus salilacus]|uniref:hypothetical protein n=1 Tax=Halorussus salilacus TaxID=2953750 RepID=UPI00209CC17B|nr:hypothetical protein [Halorussus salilacus]USZ67019.1 hypothetical protein NGM10_09785 [Halorussus salilacus]
MRKSDVLGASAVLTGGLLALPGESVVAAPLVAAAAVWMRPETRPDRETVTERFGALRRLRARGR